MLLSEAHAEFLAQYLIQVQNGTTATETLSSYITSMRVAILPNLGEKNIDEIGTRDIELLKLAILNRGCSTRTVNIRLNELSKLLKYCVKSGYMDRLPLIKRLPSESSFKIERLYYEHLVEIRRVLESSSRYSEIRLWVEISLSTGMRPGEVCRLKNSDIDYRTNTIEIKSKNRHKPGRVIPLHPRIIEIIPDKQSEYIVRYRTTKCARRAIDRALKSISDKIGIRVTPKIFRKTVLSIMADMDVPRSKVAAIAGHKSEKTTNKYYIRHDIEALRAAFSVI